MNLIQLGRKKSRSAHLYQSSHQTCVESYHNQQDSKVTKISQIINPYAFHMTIHLLCMLDVNPKLMDYIPNSPYKIVALQILQRNLNQYQIKKGIIANFDKQIIYSLTKSIDKIKQSTIDGPIECYHHIQCWYIVLIIIYRETLFIKNYLPYHRRFFYQLFDCFSPYLVQSIRVFRSLQNYYFSLTPHYEQYIANKGYETLNQHIKKLMWDYYNQLLQKNNSLSSMMPSFTMRQISKTAQRKKVVNILISGFLSQQNDKQFEWRGMRSEMPDSQVYALEWQSTYVLEFSKFVFKIPIDLLKRGSFRQQITSKLKKNPFTDCFEIAQKTGRYLGYLLTYLFPGQFINILGYSLGSQVIVTALQEMILRNSTVMINKIISLGGVSDVRQFSSLLERLQYPVNVINCYTTQDMILKYLLRQTMPDLSAIGLNIIPETSGKHIIINKDVSSIVSGHVSYMLNFDEVASTLKLYND